MNFFEEINWLPRLPNYLIESLHVIESRKNVNPNSFPEIYSSRIVSNDLQNWAQSFFPYPIIARWQVQHKDLGVHVDSGIKGIKYNYYVNLGGENVDTLFWDSLDNPLNIIGKYKIKLFTWYALQIDIPHSTQGLSYPPRLSLTIKKIN